MFKYWQAVYNTEGQSADGSAAVDNTANSGPSQEGDQFNTDFVADIFGGTENAANSEVKGPTPAEQRANFLDDVDLPPVGEDGVVGTSDQGNQGQGQQVEAQPPAGQGQGAPAAQVPVSQLVTQGQAAQPNAQQAPVGQGTAAGQQNQQQAPQGEAGNGQGTQQQQQAPVQQVQHRPIDPFAVAQEALAAQEAQFTDALAEKVYPISDEQMQGLLSGEAGSGKAVSKLLAQVHINAVSSVMRVVSQQMPVMVGGLLQFQKLVTDRETQFWAANPHLDAKQHAQYVPPIANAYKQLNPNADAATIDKMVGLMIAAHLGIQPQQPNQQQQQKPAAQQTPGRVVRQRGAPAFSPAVANGGAPQGNAAPQGSGNPWADFAEDFIRSEAGAFDHL